MEAHLQELAVDTGCSPDRVLCSHTKDQRPNLLSHGRYNRGRPHSNLGSGMPGQTTSPTIRRNRHRLEATERVTSKAILGGLHHEYGLERSAAWVRFNSCGGHPSRFLEAPFSLQYSR